MLFRSNRPRLFDRHIVLPELLYERVVEAQERMGAHGEVIEPLVSTQWFVKTKGMADKGIEAVRSGEMQIIPQRFEKTWYNWLDRSVDGFQLDSVFNFTLSRSVPRCSLESTASWKSLAYSSLKRPLYCWDVMFETVSLRFAYLL